MKKKQVSCYLLLGNILVFALAVICSLTFAKANIQSAADEADFESAYQIAIDFIAPAPSYSQVEEIEQSSTSGVSVMTPYSETSTPVSINGNNYNGTALLFPYEDKMQYTPYCDSQIISGETSCNGGSAIVDEKYVLINGCSIGDTVTISIANHEYSFRIVSIAKTNINYNGTIALVFSHDDALQLQSDGIRYSAAYICASDIHLCKAFLNSEYKPLGRLKDRSEFSNDDTYSQHVQNFESADWSKEITDVHANYEILSVRYDNVLSATITNIVIMSVVVSIAIIVFNIMLLKKDSIQKFMKTFLVKKSGTKDEIKRFYKMGICTNAIFFCILITCLNFFIAYTVHYSLVSLQILNCLIPALVCIVTSLIMSFVCTNYVENHYKIKRNKDSAEIEVEIVK